MGDRDIPEEMVEKAAHTHAELDGYDWDQVSSFWQGRYRKFARAVLSAALAGRQVVELPEPDGTDDGGTWWNHDLGAVIADHLCTAETVRVMRRRAGALLAAAEHIERNRSGSGED